MERAVTYDLKYRAGMDGHYKELCREIERVTRSISQLRRHKKGHRAAVLSLSNFIIYIVVPMLLAYVFCQVN